MEHYGIKIPNTIRVFTKDTKHKELFYALIYETMSKLPAGDPTNKITATIEALLDSVIANKFGDDPEDIKQGVERYLAQADAKHNNAAWPSLLMTYKELENEWNRENTGGETKRAQWNKHQILTW